MICLTVESYIYDDIILSQVHCLTFS